MPELRWSQASRGKKVLPSQAQVQGLPCPHPSPLDISFTVSPQCSDCMLLWADLFFPKVSITGEQRKEGRRTGGEFTHQPQLSLADAERDGHHTGCRR
jgi:hypothetical protein